MDFFKLFDLPRQFDCDSSDLRTRYQALQQLHHPDTQAHADPSAKANALRHSAFINDAYQTLSSPTKRAIYLLSLQGINTLNERDTKMPASFLTAQMEVREALSLAMDFESVNDIIANIDLNATKLCTDFANFYASEAWLDATNIARQMQFISKVKQDAEAKLDQL